MYILYLDESGVTSNWQYNKNFVIAGVAIHESQITTLGNNMKTIREKYFPSIAFPIEFHAVDIRTGVGIFRSLRPAIREQVLCDLYQSMADTQFPMLTIFGSVMNVDSAHNAVQARHDTFEEVISGFNSFLVMGHRLKHTNKGLVIIDKNREEHYRQLLDDFKQEGTKYGYLANIVDIPYFARCRATPMLQYADLCAYALFRHYERHHNTYLDLILPKIYRNIDGRMFGLKHITKVKPCDCVSCVTQTSLPSR